MIDETNHSTEEPRGDDTLAEALGSGGEFAAIEQGEIPPTGDRFAQDAADEGAEPALDVHDPGGEEGESSADTTDGAAGDDAAASEVPGDSSLVGEGGSTAAGRKRGSPREEVIEPVGPTGKRDWYILKVQSNREDSIREALQRRIAMAGLDGYFGDIIVPIEMVSEFKNGKKRVVKRKLYPGYLVVHMELNEDTWFLVRETHGIGDFTGSGGKPSPMLPHEVSRILSKQEEKADEAPKLNIKFRPGDRVKITEGTFENFEGDVDTIDEANGRVTVMINIFGRSTPVELEYWQVESL